MFWELSTVSYCHSIRCLQAPVAASLGCVVSLRRFVGALRSNSLEQSSLKFLIGPISLFVQAPLFPSIPPSTLGDP